MDPLDKKLNSVFDGKALRKDLLHRIKKGTNVPTFVLEFLLARYCASSDQAEIDAGMDAVLVTLQDNYVRPDEANAAQSKVATKGKHRFIDKVHVRYVEKEKRHWASLENFNSQRIAINQKYYKDNDRLLEGGIWAEVVIAHNDIEDDDYAFYVEDLRPIQLSRFDFARYGEGRSQFSREKAPTIKNITLVTTSESKFQQDDTQDKLEQLRQSLLEMDIVLEITFNPNLHDREIRLDNGWIIKIGRGLDFYQKPGSWYEIGSNDLSMRKCLETKVDIFKR